MSAILGAQVDLPRLLLWLGAIMVIALLGGLVLLAMRRRVLAGPATESQQQGRLLDDLRAMRDRGEISSAEFDAAKTAMAARLAGKASPRPLTPPAALRAPDGSLIAKPGMDLTGSPLPPPAGSPPNESL